MIRHVVMWKFKEKADGHDRQANLARVKKGLEGLPSKMPDIIRSLSVGVNVLENGTNWDLVLIVDVDSLEALDSYVKHPEHEKVAEVVMRVREQRVAADYVF